MAAKLPRDEVVRVAELAHLTLTEAEAEQFGRQLADILDWVNAIRQADTSGVEPTAHASTTARTWREDERLASLSKDDALRSAPDADVTAGLFRVPSVR